LVFTLAMITFQDFKERQVWAFLFPLFGILGGILFYNNTFSSFYLISIAINLGIVICIILANFLISKFLLKKNFFKEALGLGDLLFFVGFALSFPTITFVNFFVFSLLFTLVLFWILKKVGKLKEQSIPLAGCMALFLGVVYLIHWTGLYKEIYIL